MTFCWGEVTGGEMTMGRNDRIPQILFPENWPSFNDQAKLDNTTLNLNQEITQDLLELTFTRSVFLKTFQWKSLPPVI